jgi:predicted RND superfamily exporter protein
MLQKTKNKIEEFFGDLSDYIFDNRIKVIVVVLALTLALASQLKYIALDTSTEGFLHKDSKELLKYNKFREQFGKDERTIITIRSNDIFSIEFLIKLDKLHKELENNTPYLEDISSLINSRNTYGTKDSLIVDDLFKILPKIQY